MRIHTHNTHSRTHTHTYTHTCMRTHQGDEVQGGLQLSNSLLVQGGHKVQAKFFEALKRPNAESFLRELLVRMEIAGDEIRETKAIVRQVVMNAKPDPGKRSTLHALMDEANIMEEMNSNEDQDEGLRSDRSFVCDVLSFVKNLCEGHFLPMQNLLRKQDACDHSVDLVTAVAQFVIELESSISPLNIDIAIQAFETLTEFLQVCVCVCVCVCYDAMIYV